MNALIEDDLEYEETRHTYKLIGVPRDWCARNACKTIDHRLHAKLCTPRD